MNQCIYNKFKQLLFDICFRDNKPFNIFEDNVIMEMAKKYKKSQAQVILRYFLQSNVVMIPRSITPSRIQENCNIFDFSLENEDVEIIHNLDK